MSDRLQERRSAGTRFHCEGRRAFLRGRLAGMQHDRRERKEHQMTRHMLATVAGAALLAGASAASAQTGVGPRYGHNAYGYTSATPWNSSAPRGGTYKMRAFKSQELLPQSPPEGGY